MVKSLHWQLDDAIKLAHEKHEGQVDKGGWPYIYHPLKVMSGCTTLESMIVGVLHDVIEDTDVTIDYFVDNGYSEDIIEALIAITRAPGESYNQYISRVSTSEIAIEVKICDLTHNLDLSRLPSYPNSTKRELDNARKYESTLNKLKKIKGS